MSRRFQFSLNDLVLLLLMIAGPVSLLRFTPDWRMRWAAVGALVVIAAVDIAICVRDQSRPSEVEKSNAAVKARLERLQQAQDEAKAQGMEFSIDAWWRENE